MQTLTQPSQAQRPEPVGAIGPWVHAGNDPRAPIQPTPSQPSQSHQPVPVGNVGPLIHPSIELSAPIQWTPKTMRETPILKDAMRRMTVQLIGIDQDARARMHPDVRRRPVPAVLADADRARLKSVQMHAQRMTDRMFEGEAAGSKRVGEAPRERSSGHGVRQDSHAQGQSENLPGAKRTGMDEESPGFDAAVRKSLELSAPPQSSANRPALVPISSLRTWESLWGPDAADADAAADPTTATASSPTEEEEQQDHGRRPSGSPIHESSTELQPSLLPRTGLSIPIRDHEAYVRVQREVDQRIFRCMSERIVRYWRARGDEMLERLRVGMCREYGIEENGAAEEREDEDEDEDKQGEV